MNKSAASHSVKSEGSDKTVSNKDESPSPAVRMGSNQEDIENFNKTNFGLENKMVDILSASEGEQDVDDEEIEIQ